MCLRAVLCSWKLEFFVGNHQQESLTKHWPHVAASLKGVVCTGLLYAHSGDVWHFMLNTTNEASILSDAK